MAAAGITMIVQFTYRGADEEFSQQYHIADTFVDQADFQAACGDLRVYAADVFPAGVQFMRFYGYDDTDEPHAYVYDVSYASYVGAFDTTDLTRMPGDDACWVRWRMAHLSSRGKPVYLRKYFHPVYVDEEAGFELVASDQKNALEAFADNCVTNGFNGHTFCDPHGTAPTNDYLASSYVTTRTLKRRGRRPPPP